MAVRLKPKGEDRFSLNTLTPDFTLPKGYLSASAVSMYLRCPKQYEFRYIHGRKSPPSVAMQEGISHHHWLEKNNTRKILTSEDMAVRDAFDIFEDHFTKDSRGIEDWERESKDSVLHRGFDLVKSYLTGDGKDIQPVVAERKFEEIIGGVPVMGFIDVEEKDRVWDYKVVGRPKTKRDAKNDIQLSIYARVSKKSDVGFVSLIKKSRPDTEKVPCSLTETEINWTDSVVGSVAEAIKKGSFPMTDPSNWNCSERFCGFWHLCRGRKR